MTHAKEKPIIRLSDKSEKLTVRCPAELKRAVAIAAIERKTTIETLCIEFIAAGLGLKLDAHEGQAA